MRRTVTLVVALGGALALGAGSLPAWGDDGDDEPKKPQPRERDRDRDDRERPGEPRAGGFGDEGDDRRPPGHPRTGQGRDKARPSDDEVEEFLKKHFPEWLEEQERAFKANPDRADDMKERMGNEVARMMFLSKERPQDFERMKARRKAEFRVHTLAERIRRADAKDQEALKKELRAAVEELFTQALEEKAKDVEELEAQVKRARARLEEMKKQRETMIDSRLRRILGEDEW
jgi:hypothetical protein